MEAKIHFEELAAITRIYQRRARDAMVELGPAIAEAMHAEVLNVFETEGYGQWPGFWWERAGLPKPGSTPRRDGKKRKGKSYRRWKGDPKLLQDTGNLAGSMTPEWNDRAVEVYTNVPYIRYHASREPREVIPLRDPLAIDAAAFEADVADMLLIRLRRPIAAE